MHYANPHAALSGRHGIAQRDERSRNFVNLTAVVVGWYKCKNTIDLLANAQSMTGEGSGQREAYEQAQKEVASRREEASIAAAESQQASTRTTVEAEHHDALDRAVARDRLTRRAETTHLGSTGPGLRNELADVFSTARAGIVRLRLERAEHRLDALKRASHHEAMDLEARHEQLKSQVASALEALRVFEDEELGMRVPSPKS